MSSPASPLDRLLEAARAFLAIGWVHGVARAALPVVAVALLVGIYRFARAGVGRPSAARILLIAAMSAGALLFARFAITERISVGLAVVSAVLLVRLRVPAAWVIFGAAVIGFLALGAPH